MNDIAALEKRVDALEAQLEILVMQLGKLQAYVLDRLPAHYAGMHNMQGML